MSRGSHDTSSVVGRRANQATARRRQRFNSFSNGESVYSHEMTLQREQRCCVGTEKRRKNDGLTREHRRAHSEAENNITETVIHEHPGSEIPLSSSLQNTSSLHGELLRRISFFIDNKVTPIISSLLPLLKTSFSSSKTVEDG